MCLRLKASIPFNITAGFASHAAGRKDAVEGGNKRQKGERGLVLCESGRRRGKYKRCGREREERGRKKEEKKTWTPAGGFQEAGREPGLRSALVAFMWVSAPHATFFLFLSTVLAAE